jgi:tight adherence protein B
MVALIFGCAVLALAAAWEAAAVLERSGLIARLAADDPLASTARLRAPALREPRTVAALCTLAAVLGGWLAGFTGVAALAGATLAGAQALRRAGAVRERRAVERGVPGFARVLADALAAGHALRAALALASEDRSITPALRRRLRLAAARLAVGATLGTTLSELAAPDERSLRLLCGTVALHLESGGALPEALRRLAASEESAARAEAEARSATAQSRATVRVVAALPLLGLVLAQLGSGDLIAHVARKPIALALLICGLSLELAAVLASSAILRSVNRS